MLKDALEKAVKSYVGLRHGIPVDIWTHFGSTYAGFDANARRTLIRNHIKQMLLQKIDEHLDIDDAVDKMAVKFQHDALPPVRFLLASFLFLAS